MNEIFDGLDPSTRFGDDPIQVAPDLWWVGGRIEDDPFQCHAYLLCRGDQSVLFDPGSVLTWAETKRKIETLISFDDIRWFVVQHQDPDVCGAMPIIAAADHPQRRCVGLADFEGVRAFHQHYMPDRNILMHAMLKLEQLPLQMIAPQHGKIIVGEDIGTYITRLKNLDCGLYLLTRTDSDIGRLQALNNLMRDTVEAMATERDFRVLVGHIFAQVGEERALWMSSSDRFRGSEIQVPDGLRDLTATAESWTPDHTRAIASGPLPVDRSDSDIVLPLFRADESTCLGMAILAVGEDFQPSLELDETLIQVSRPLSVALEREVINRMIHSPIYLLVATSTMWRVDGSRYISATPRPDSP